MTYELFRGPDPSHRTGSGRLRTFDEWWEQVVIPEKFIQEHVVVGKPEFVGRMPQRVDLEVLPYRKGLPVDVTPGFFIRHVKALQRLTI